MRTLWITNDLPPRAGGIEQFVANLLARIEPDQTLVVGPAHPEAATHDARVGHEVHRLSGSVLPTPATRRIVRELAARHQPDVIVLGACWPLGEMAAALDRDVAPVVAISHGLEAGLATVGLGRLVGRATRGVTTLTTISDYTEGHLVKHERSGGMVRVPPGVDVDVFHPGVDGASMRATWGVPPGALLVGCISRLVDRKGQDTLLRVWPRVAAAHPDAWLVLAGVGPREARLRAMAASLRPDAHVVLPGRVPWEHLASAHAALDVFAMPCRTRLAGLDVEGLGIVYLEAQAVGVPVIAGRSGGAPEAVVDGVSGLVVDGANDDEVVEAVVALLDDPARRASMGAAGRANVLAKWSWEVIAQRFRGVLAAAAR